MVEEDQGGHKSGILVKWSGGGYDAAFQLPRFLSHSPTSSSTHKDALHTSPQGTVTPKQLHSAHGWIRHPFLSLPLPPPGGWVPLLQREGGKGWMCVWGGAGSELDLVLTYDKLVPRAMTAAHRTITLCRTSSPVGRRMFRWRANAARGSKSGHNLYFYLTPPPPGSYPSFLPLAFSGLPPPFGVGDAHSHSFSLPRALPFTLPLERAGLGSGCSGTWTRVVGDDRDSIPVFPYLSRFPLCRFWSFRSMVWLLHRPPG